ncbi:hypothetical protein L2737_05100 [Shewanella electrodiphila]|uniref:Uncharacterized protein n=1 Tax=Shewanella electrodiphila TaxID=934143 RepID=A0ABT0KMY1_9GAMM|nr:hypothetical protein [Shewanella electrodiphila]MCL1044705.1 hypothetical protein [Shewanella electrodiphila]
MSGIIVLDISNLRLSSTSKNNNGYASQLVTLITEQAAIKTWYWHVREDALKRKADVLATEREQQLIAEHKQANQFKPAPMSEIEADFEREANNGMTYNSEAQTIAGISAQELIDYQSKIKKTRCIYQAVAGNQIKTSSMYRCSRCHLDFNFNQHSDQCPRCSTNFFSYPIR